MEQKVSNTLLEEKQKIVIGGEVLEMKPPSIATLVLASKYISQLPNKMLDEKNAIPDLIKNAERIVPISSAIAVMVLGAVEFEKKQKGMFGIGLSKKTKGDVLAERIMNADIKELKKTFFVVLGMMNLSDFFQLTTFLIEMNITKTTRRVVT